SAAHTEYTITGDSVNLAARLTDLAKSGETLVAASVQRALGESFRGVDLGEQVIKGLSEPVSVWRLDELSAEQSESSQKFVGRSRELGQFVAALEHCSEMGKGQTVIVRGEAGVGKSRLVEEFSNLAQAKEFAIHTGLILDFGTAKGQDAIGALVRGLLDIPRGSGKAMRAEAARRAVNSGWIPEERLVHLNDLLDLPQPPNLAGIHEAMDNATRNLGKQETLGDLIQTKSEATKLLVRIEDTHWADQVILAHLAHLVRAVQSIPVLLILTSRITGDKLDQNWRAGTEGAPLMAIDLSPLDSSEASDLAQYFGDLDEDVISACVERSGGNPLFLEQLLRNADELTAGNIPG
ncbi:MAG: AAA family ATPase, partial [Pseudomonadales bacterium]|nr:AAA family ATPase [Pseudomonadales bacterium]